MNGLDGNILRELRRRAGLGLRAIERRSAGRVTESHLSRVERGERRITPAVVALYEKALGASIEQAAQELGREQSETQRQAFNALMAGLAVGGPPGETVTQLVEAGAAAVPAPERVGLAEVAHVEAVAATVRQLDWEFGGGIAWQVADRLSRWALGLRAAPMTDAARVRLHRALGVLAMRAGWAAFDGDQHEPARAMFSVALSAAVQARDTDLRAHVLADVGAQHNYLGFPDDCLQMVWLADNEQVGSAVRSLLHGVKAHAYAAKGDSRACTREITLAETAGAAVDPPAVPDWFGGFDPAHTQAVCGQAAAVLATATGTGGDLAEATKRLSGAVAGLCAAGRKRAMTRCQIQLAILHLRAGDRDEAAAWGQLVLGSAPELRSARVNRELGALHTNVASVPEHSLLRELAGRLGAL